MLSCTEMTCFWLIQTHLPFSDCVNNFVYCAAFVLSMAAHVQPMGPGASKCKEPGDEARLLSENVCRNGSHGFWYESDDDWLFKLSDNVELSTIISVPVV